jgi:hypothetical protein
MKMCLTDMEWEGADGSCGSGQGQVEASGGFSNLP